MHACACMHVRMSVCGKYEGMYVRRQACTCVWTTLTPTPTRLNIGCEASHGLVLALAVCFGRGLALRFALRAITHTHTSTHTKAIYAYIHLSITEVPVACSAHLARLARMISAGAWQPPLYTDAPAGPQPMVRPSLGHLVVGELEGKECRLPLPCRTRTGRHIGTALAGTDAAVERHPQVEDWAGAWRPPLEELLQRRRPFELDALAREEVDVRAVLGNELGDGLAARDARPVREHVLLLRRVERQREVEGVAVGRLESELRGLSIVGVLRRRDRQGLPQLAL